MSGMDIVNTSVCHSSLLNILLPSIYGVYLPTLLDDPYWATELAEYKYALCSMYDQLRWYGHHKKSRLHGRPWKVGRGVPYPSHDQVVEYIKRVEMQRLNRLEFFVTNIYLKRWYPMRLLELDTFCRRQGLPKGRGRCWRSYMIKYMDACDQPSMVMIPVSVRLMNGDVLDTYMDPSRGFLSLEEELYRAYPDRFPLNHVEIITPNPYHYPVLRQVTPGVVIDIFVHPFDESHQTIRFTTINPSLIRLDIQMYTYFCCRLIRNLGSLRISHDYGRPMECPPSRTHTIVYYYNKMTRRIQNLPDSRQATTFHTHFEDFLAAMASWSRFRWTPEAHASLIKQWQQSDLIHKIQHDDV